MGGGDTDGGTERTAQAPAPAATRFEAAGPRPDHAEARMGPPTGAPRARVQELERYNMRELAMSEEEKAAAKAEREAEAAAGREGQAARGGKRGGGAGAAAAPAAEAGAPGAAGASGPAAGAPAAAPAGGAPGAEAAAAGEPAGPPAGEGGGEARGGAAAPGGTDAAEAGAGAAAAPLAAGTHVHERDTAAGREGKRGLAPCWCTQGEACAALDSQHFPRYQAQASVLSETLSRCNTAYPVKLTPHIKARSAVCC